MTTSVSLCLSYNHFRLDIIALTIVQQKMHRPSCHGRRHDI